MNEHLTDDQLIDQLYGVDHDPHAQTCAECGAKLAAMERTRAELTDGPAVSGDFLAGQRRKIYSRLGEQPRSNLIWAPAALAAAGLVALVMFSYRPAVKTAAPAAHAVTSAQSDAQLFSDVYSMEQSTEPRAAAPIHALLEDNQ